MLLYATSSKAILSSRSTYLRDLTSNFCAGYIIPVLPFLLRGIWGKMCICLWLHSQSRDLGEPGELCRSSLTLVTPSCRVSQAHTQNMARG
ncbi:hypothetical protein HZ326_30022 [Fusarium oxysporum f. sp. albedinis]|nr:hypothetical protein HZ326_30022 [Fusarium oxysporum f. sp. albedinis]